MGLTDEKIDGFWIWFVKHFGFIDSALFGKYPGDAWVVGKAVDKLGVGLQWEAGPGLVEPKAFTISPDGDPAKLASAEAVVARAPALMGWEFHATKPPKRWNFTLQFPGSPGDLQIDCSTLRYVLAGDREDRGYDIHFYYDERTPPIGSSSLVARLLAEGCRGATDDDQGRAGYPRSGKFLRSSGRSERGEATCRTF